MPRAFDYEKQYTYKDEFGQTHIEYYPMQYINSVSTSVPVLNGDWMNYGSGLMSKENPEICEVEITDGDILNSGCHIANQISCKSHSYNIGNYYNFPAASAKSNEPTLNSVCPKGWRLPEHDGDTDYSRLYDFYGINYSSISKSTDYDAAMLMQPLSMLRGGNYSNNQPINRWYLGFYRKNSKLLLLVSNQLNMSQATFADGGYSLRCVRGK